MELCSLFQDLVYSIEIAAHEAGLEHYTPHMYFDAVTAVQRYCECFVPEAWTPPFNIHAEIEFEMSPLDIARAQLSDRGIIETLGVMVDEGEIENNEENFGPIAVNLDLQFVMTVHSLCASSDKWDDYCHKVAERDRLQAGLENIQHRLQRALGNTDAEKRPTVHVQAHTPLTDAGRLALSKLTAHWPVCIEADIEDDLRQAVLEDMMNRVHAGLDALEEFAQDILEDFAATTADK